MTSPRVIAHSIANKYRSNRPGCEYDDLRSVCDYWAWYYRETEDGALLYRRISVRLFDYLRLINGRHLQKPCANMREVEHVPAYTEPTQESDADIALALDKMTERGRSYFLRWLYGELQEDIAAKEGISYARVCQLIQRPKQIMRDVYES